MYYRHAIHILNIYIYVYITHILHIRFIIHIPRTTNLLYITSIVYISQCVNKVIHNACALYSGNSICTQYTWFIVDTPHSYYCFMHDPFEIWYMRDTYMIDTFCNMYIQKLITYVYNLNTYAQSMICILYMNFNIYVIQLYMSFMPSTYYTYHFN